MTPRVPATRVPALLAALLLVAPGLGGCSDAGYTLRVQFEPSELASDVSAIRVGLVPSCGAQPLGEPPRDADHTLELRRGEELDAFSDVEEGTFGLYAVGRADGCEVKAAGCTPVELKPGGSGTLTVVLEPASGPGCAECNGRGVCTGTGDGGMDAGTDAGTDGATDGGTDAPCDCPDCAVCTAGGCEPDHGRCGELEYCSPITGCEMGTPCPADGGACPDDGNPCTTGSCDRGRSPALCVYEAVEDATDCSEDGAPGLCYDGACCTGCWTGSECHPGTEAAACGTGGGSCASCTCPRNACTGGECALAVPVSYLEAGGNHTCAVGEDGTLWCWGGNPQGELGIGTAGSDETAPVQVGSASDWETLMGGEQHTCALRNGDEVWCWGDNPDGQLGLGDSIDRVVPDMVSRTGWDVIGDGNRGGDHSCALDGDALWCWGEDQYGQLGIAGSSDRDSPVMVAGTWASVAPGEDHTCAIALDGTAWCWGRDNDGQLGLGGSTGHSEPQQVGTESDWTAITTGEWHSCGIRAGQVWCWGRGSDGQLGDGETVARSAPVRAGTASDWTRIEAGRAHTCGLRSDGSLWCWGDAGSGRLGLGGAGATTPTRVGDRSDWAQIGPGNAHTCALDAEGLVWCTGANDVGQLGLGDRTGRDTLAAVCFTRE